MRYRRLGQAEGDPIQLIQQKDVRVPVSPVWKGSQSSKKRMAKQRLLPHPVGSAAKTSFPSTKAFTTSPCFCFKSLCPTFSTAKGESVTICQSGEILLHITGECIYVSMIIQSTNHYHFYYISRTYCLQTTTRSLSQYFPPVP